jgi:DNA (cytosine-5)-methyltransferase 1
MKTISLFSGAGGLDIGATLAGADIVCCVDTDADSIETLKTNNYSKNAKHILADITSLSGKELLSQCDLNIGEVDFVIGGPPCQSFSKNSYWTKSGEESLRRRERMKSKADSEGREFKASTELTKTKNRIEVDNDDRSNLVMEYARLIEEISPSGFLFENVLSITHPKHKKYLENFISKMESCGYSTREFRLSSENFGVAQKRKRVFVVGSKVALPKDPKLTHSFDETLFLPTPVTSGEVIRPFCSEKYFEKEEVITGQWSQYLPDIPPGMNYKALTSWAGYENPIFEAETKFWNFLLKLHPEKVSWTIPANPGPWIGPLHWENRRLRTVEMAAIQSFPSDYVFYGNRRSKVRQIGNAVPPLMAKAVMETLL